MLSHSVLILKSKKTPDTNQILVEVKYNDTEL
jgi:hypothetical protein